MDGWHPRLFRPGRGLSSEFNVWTQGSRVHIMHGVSVLRFTFLAMPRFWRRFRVGPCDAQKCAGGAFGAAVALLPVLEGAAADAHEGRRWFLATISRLGRRIDAISVVAAMNCSSALPSTPRGVYGVRPRAFTSVGIIFPNRPARAERQEPWRVSGGRITRIHMFTGAAHQAPLQDGTPRRGEGRGRGLRGGGGLAPSSGGCGG